MVNSLGGWLATDTPNSALFDALHGISSTDYQRRIPLTTDASIAQTVGALTDPQNRRWLNEFVDVLVNRIGMTVARSNSWTNPLATFKRGMLNYGSTIEEIQVGLLEAYDWDPDLDYGEKALFGRELPEIQTQFHTVNRQNMYKVSIKEAMLKRAFTEESGLSALVSQIMAAPTTSDQLDEFLLTAKLFKRYEDNGGFFKVQVPDIANMSSTTAQAMQALRKMRTMAGNLKFLSTDYNASHMPVFASEDSLILFITPEANAAIDVDALAGAFNIDRANLKGRIFELPATAFAIPGCQAIMTTSDFFVIADTLFESTSQWNPVSLMNNYFMHHHEIISCSRFVPAVMFTTDSGSVQLQGDPTYTITTLTVAPDDAEAVVQPGAVLSYVCAAVTSPTGYNPPLIWSVSGSTADTFITANGELHISARETAATLTVKATSAGPAGNDTLAVTVTYPSA